RQPWFGGHNYHEPIPLAYDLAMHSVVLNVGRRTDRVWHFWSPSPRAAMPEGEVEGCTARARVRISQRALLQMGFDYWRSPTVPYGSAEITTRRAQATGIFLLISGRTSCSVISEGRSSKHVDTAHQPRKHPELVILRQRSRSRSERSQRRI